MVLRKILFYLFIYFSLIGILYSGDFDALYRNGLRQLEAGKYDLALEKFEAAYKVAEMSGQEVKILFAISDIYYLKKEYAKAQDWVNRIFDIPDLKYNDKVDAYHRLIDCFVKLKRYDDALAEIRIALRRISSEKDKSAFLGERARIFELQKKYEKAIKSWYECIEICKKGSSQWKTAQKQYIAGLFKLKKYEQGLEHINNLQLDDFESSSKMIVVYYGGLCAYRQGNYTLAVKWLNKMSEKGPSWLIYSRNIQLGSAYKKIHQYEKAFKCFQDIYNNKGLQNYYRANSLWMMAELRYIQKKYEDATELCEQLRKFPGASNNQVKRAENLIRKIKEKP